MTDAANNDPDRVQIDRLYPSALKVGAPFEIKTGPMTGKGTCIRRRLSQFGVLFTILFEDGGIREWDWWN